ncbi:MAG: transglutaminase family protein [Spirochaetia bacterium]|jgi:transglutaminase-like putative cysteine protease|nr:transglutaminase family protein [Spirochaetia bacterium]
MKPHGRILLPVAILVSAACFANKQEDPLNYSVEIKNFTSLIFTQKETVYHLYSDSGKFAPPSTPFQKTKDITPQGSAGKKIEVTAGDFSAETDDADTRPFTEDTMLLNINSPEVKQLAAQIKAKNNLPRITEKFVCNYITNKFTGIPIVSAKSIIENRGGDCTEHAVLLIALLRSMGIPARAVVGMIVTPYFKGKEDSFIFHMWVEAYYDKRWNLLDATRPGDIHPNLYIAFAYHNLRTNFPLSYMKAVATIQNMTAQYSSGK